MYNVTLVNLSANARSVAGQTHIELRDVKSDALQELLRNFCEIDQIENAAGDAEIRIHVRHEKYLLRTEQKKLILYDVHQRELPGQMLSVEQAIQELDGTAAATRRESILQARAEAGPGAIPGPLLPITPAPPAASKPRVIGLLAMAIVLLAAIVWLAAPFGSDDSPPGFAPIVPEELDSVQTALLGVYMTGSEPGQHGIVVTDPGELKLFELGAEEAPRVVYAGYRLGRISPKLCLVTDQPGGVIEVTADGNLHYCGEVYQRIP
ncbi:hypothetical protein [Opitutus sp. GAS368]|uniref:hypothetical protein n=1 Tax=Opitutus sp. GAS368 TaxID=1882749 RepID=UPI00087B5423|nr:hypothetical protein [Opitutus sp. GAS368]SDS38705.1 hypothetical protein SAMN05444173_2745 [Opitutus sp. GAS368]